ncbi:acyl-CoA dehydrogenase family protein [Streptomyces sp. O3]
MRFLLDEEQRDFARSLDALLSAADTPSAVRAWSRGDPAAGRALWERLARTGVFALAVPERHQGLGPLPLELAVAFERLGRYAVPGPAVETVAAAAFLDRLDRLGLPEPAAAWLPSLASGKAVASLCLPAVSGPYALDADAADLTLVVDGDTAEVAESAGPVQPSADPARRLARPVVGGGPPLAYGPAVAEAAAYAREVAALSTAAQALGLGRTLLERTVAYARRRTQFGQPIGAFQAVKHRLADTLIALEFAQPLVHAAALALASAGASADQDADQDAAASREVAAAKVTACEAAYAAARAALQLHGALGYTDELDLSLWIRKARALRTAWGTPSQCRARVLS